MDRKFKNNISIKADGKKDERFALYEPDTNKKSNVKKDKGGKKSEEKNGTKEGGDAEVKKQEHPHDAGYDALVTGQVFCYFVKFLEIGNLIDTKGDEFEPPSQATVKVLS